MPNEDKLWAIPNQTWELGIVVAGVGTFNIAVKHNKYYA